RSPRATIGTWPPFTTAPPSGPTTTPDHSTLSFTTKSGNAFRTMLADHKIEAVSIPFKTKSIPGWLHLPPGYSGGKVPVVIAIPGMDSFKEVNVALANDRWMQRGVAVLSIDGPGQYESPLLGVYVSMQNWIDAGPAVVDWLLGRPEIDSQKIGVS